VATPTKPNKYSTVASNTNNIFVGKDLSEDVKMFVRASVAENTWKNIIVLGNVLNATVVHYRYLLQCL
jgi:hypothetical protein